jgi:hypothetical protein
MKTYIVTVRLTVDDDAEHLESTEAVAAEVRSWLEGLNADVDTVTVAEEEQS